MQIMMVITELWTSWGAFYLLFSNANSCCSCNSRPRIQGLWSLEAPRLKGVTGSFVLVSEVNGKLGRNQRTPPSGRMVRRTLCFLQCLQIWVSSSSVFQPHSTCKNFQAWRVMGKVLLLTVLHSLLFRQEFCLVRSQCLQGSCRTHLLAGQLLAVLFMWVLSDSLQGTIWQVLGALQKSLYARFSITCRRFFRKLIKSIYFHFNCNIFLLLKRKLEGIGILNKRPTWAQVKYLSFWLTVCCGFMLWKGVIIRSSFIQMSFATSVAWNYFVHQFSCMNNCVRDSWGNYICRNSKWQRWKAGVLLYDLLHVPLPPLSRLCLMWHPAAPPWPSAVLHR